MTVTTQRRGQRRTGGPLVHYGRRNCLLRDFALHGALQSFYVPRSSRGTQR